MRSISVSDIFYAININNINYLRFAIHIIEKIVKALSDNRITIKEEYDIFKD